MKGENLKSALKKKGIAQRGLADVLGCSINTVWRWCNDKQEASDRTKKRLSEILDVTVSYLMGESEDIETETYERDNLPKETAPYYGVSEHEPVANFPDNKIIVEIGIGKDKRRCILPATPESYDFLKWLNGSEGEISPEKSTILKMMESMTQEEIKAMFDLISAKRT